MENQLERTGNNNHLSTVNDSELLMHLDNLGLTQKLTPEEKNTYLQIAKAFNLNPFKREIHVSKYGEGQYAKMSIITGYEVYIKRAERSGLLDGWECTTEGSVAENNLKAIITIYRKDRKYPFKHEVYYSEYVGKTKTGQVTQFWEKAQTMTKKVAMSQGFRLCFSDELGGMPYTKEEMSTIEDVTHEIITIELPTMEATKAQLTEATDLSELVVVWNSLTPYQKNLQGVAEYKEERKLEFLPNN